MEPQSWKRWHDRRLARCSYGLGPEGAQGGDATQARRRYEGTFDGHNIELVRHNLDKTLNLVIDGTVVASEHRWLPKEITLHAEFEHNGIKHTVVAHQHVKPILGLPIATDDSIEIDGKPLPLTKMK